MTSPRRLSLPADLLTRLRLRDESAYRELFDRSWPALLAIAAAIVQSRDIAEDVVQDVMCRLWAQGERLMPAGDFGDYLVTAVRNTALTALRDSRRLRQRHDRLAAMPPEEGGLRPIVNDDGPPPDTPWDEELAKLRRVLATLTEHQRTAFTLRYSQGMTNAEIARVLGISLKGAEQLTARLKKLLRDRLLDPAV